MFPNVCKHHLIIYGCIKFTFKTCKKYKKVLKKKSVGFFVFLWKIKISLSQIFWDLYSHKTIVPCTRRQESICNWRSFCGFCKSLSFWVSLVSLMRSDWKKIWNTKSESCFLALGSSYEPVSVGDLIEARVIASFTIM